MESTVPRVPYHTTRGMAEHKAFVRVQDWWGRESERGSGSMGWRRVHVAAWPSKNPSHCLPTRPTQQGEGKKEVRLGPITPRLTAVCRSTGMP